MIYPTDLHFSASFKEKEADPRGAILLSPPIAGEVLSAQEKELASL